MLLDSPPDLSAAVANGGRSDAVAAALERLRDAVDEVAQLDLDSCDGDLLRRLARDVTRQCGRLEGVRARAVHSATRTGEVERTGATSGAAWLADATGGTTTAAARTAALGQAFERVPTLAEAVVGGTVGSEHAASIARAASRGVLADDQLDRMVDQAATLPAGAFSRSLRGIEARTDQRQLRRDERLARQRRSARWWRSDDGSIEGRFRLDPVAGEKVVTALDVLSTPDPADVPDEARRTPDQRRADALTALGELALARGELPVTSTVRPHVTVTVPVTMLLDSDDQAEAAGAAGTLPDGTIISAQAARQLLCDATVRRLVVDPAGQPLDVGRATRTWSSAQRTAVGAVDGRCRGPACDRPLAWTEIHHVRWWRHRGHTAVSNGVALCGRCHDLVHHGGWLLGLDPGTRLATWTSPTGRIVVTHPAGPAAPSHHRR